MKHTKNMIGVVAIGLLFSAVLGFAVVQSYTGSAQNVTENGDINVYNGESFKEGGALGAVSGIVDSRLTTGEVTLWNSGQFEDVVVENDLFVDGVLTSNGSFNYLETNTSITTSTVLTAADSGETFYISGAAAAFTLPATSTSAGVVYRFVIGGAITGNITIATAGGANEIEGSLIVAGAVVDCDAEDTITFVGDGENLGDFVELRSNGSKWYIGASGALTASKLTCTAT